MLLGKRDLVVGLTEKAIWLDGAMRAAFREMVVDMDDDRIDFEPGALEAIGRRFDGAWNHVGVKRSPLKTAIMDVLAEGPLSSEEIFEAVKKGVDDGEEPEFKDLTSRQFSRAFRDLLEGEILTQDPAEMWTLGEPS